ncbi:MAG: tetratricopeptide repeat protein [Chloroflexi bacterium]|nr:tetratricopeptide repeat protein [Chloroflexota bacterium]
MTHDDAEKFLEEGKRLYGLGKYQEALESYDKALAIDPKFAPAWYGKGGVLRRLGQLAEAAAAYRTYVSLEPKDAGAFNLLGCALFELRRYRQALTAYEAASVLARDNPLYHHNCAVSLHRIGKTNAAKERLERALRIDGNFAEARDALEHPKAGHPVWWWEWWFGQSRGRRAVGFFLALLLALYLVMPLFQEGAKLPGLMSTLAWNPGKGYQHYLAPVAAILLLLVLPSVLKLGPHGVELSPVAPKEEPKLAPLERREMAASSEKMPDKP